MQAYMDAKTIDVYMSYGLRSSGDFSTYKSNINGILDNVIKDTGIKLLARLPAYALDAIRDRNDTAEIEAIASEFDTESKIWAYYIDEPNNATNNYTDADVDAARGKLGKDLISAVDTNGANQQTFDDYAKVSDIICGWDYPNSTSEWSNIGSIGDTDHPLHYLKNNSFSGTPSCRPYWFCVELQDNGSQRAPTQAEVNWMTHRAIYDGVTGILYYSFEHADSTSRTYMKNICSTINTYRAQEILATTQQHGLVSQLSGADILWAYYKYDREYYLLVLDGDPEHTGSSTRNYAFECSLENQTNFADFGSLLSLYNGSVAITTSAGTASYTKKFSDSLTVGQVKLYRFVIQP